MYKNTTVVIANMNAGRLRKDPEIVLRYMRELGPHKTHLIEVEQLGETEKAIQNLLSVGAPERIIVMGGDGTVAEACKALSGTNVELAVFPGGTANVLALEYHFPMDVEENVEMVFRGRRKDFYPGIVENEFGETRKAPSLFIQMLGVGGDGSIVVHNSWHMKKRLGAISYFISLLQAAPTLGKTLFKVEVSNEYFDVYGAVVSLGRYYAGKHTILPERPIKGQVGVCLIKRKGLRGITDLAVHCLGFNSKHIEVIYSSRVKMFDLTDDIFAQADGSTFNYNNKNPLIIERSQKPINLIIPDALALRN